MSVRRFKPYPTYKASGVEWLGEIPAGWAVKKWRYCCRVTEGQVAPDDDRFRDRVMIAPNHIESGTGRILYTETADEQGAISGKYLVRPGDIIYSKIRPALNKACIATGDWLCSADMYPVLITEENLHARFLLYYMLSEPFVRLMVDESMRVAMPKVNREKLATCPLAIPSLIEQDAIAAFLDRKTARIDALVVKKERLIELLQEQRAALITRAVTKGLDPNVPVKDSGVEWLGEIPAHWQMLSLKRVTSIRYGLGEPPQLLADGLPLVRATNVTKGRIVDRDMQFVDPKDVPWNRDPALQTGEIIVVRSGAYTGDSAIIPESHDGAIAGYDMVVRVRRGQPKFLAWALLSQYVLEAQIELESMRAAQPHLNSEELGAVAILLPPDLEQHAIAAFLDLETERIDALVAKVREASGRLKELRTALISAAVTGKIDVREEVA